jgi:putative hydrolase of the HAD superfamily
MSRLCLVFDLDDTLYAERDFAVSAFAAAAGWADRELGLAGLDADMTALLDAGHLGQLFAMALAARKPEHTKAELDGLVRAYRQHAPERLELFGDAADALDRFAPLAKLGLITDGSAEVQAAKVRALGIAPRFRHAILTGALGPSRGYFKPHPLAFERMAAALAGPGDRLVYVGDNPAKDFQAPNRLGWTTVQIDRPAHRPFMIHRQPVVPPDGAPQHVLASLDGLDELLKT